jgi:hypothetical protein
MEKENNILQLENENAELKQKIVELIMKKIMN